LAIIEVASTAWLVATRAKGIVFSYLHVCQLRRTFFACQLSEKANCAETPGSLGFIGVLVFQEFLKFVIVCFEWEIKKITSKQCMVILNRQKDYFGFHG